MRIVLLGAPGSGKATQATKLSEHFKIPQISTRNLLNIAVKAQTPLGRQAKATMDAGQQVPNEIIFGMIRERLSRPDAINGFIIYGFPRSLEQADLLDKLLNEINQPIEHVALIQVEFDDLMERLSGRMNCDSCGYVFNIYTKPPVLEDQCDNCGSELHHRSEDNEETIASRLRIFEAQTMPLISYYKDQGKLKVIEGHAQINIIFKHLLAALKDVRTIYGSTKSSTLSGGEKIMNDDKTNDNNNLSKVGESSPQTPDSKPAPVVSTPSSNVQTPVTTTTITPSPANISAPAASKPAEVSPAAPAKTINVATKPVAVTAAPAVAKQPALAKASTPKVEKPEAAKPAVSNTQPKTTKPKAKAAEAKTVKPKTAKPKTSKKTPAKPATAKTSTKKVAAKKPVAKKKAPAPAKTVQEQIKEAREILKNTNTELKRVSSNVDKLSKLHAEGHKALQQFMAKWEKDALKKLPKA
ncbi:MAG: adenylate kinase [Gammaproteobacteria bacterium]|nr:adenylate kinase [Gammaproteobacteria bacterium]